MKKTLTILAASFLVSACGLKAPDVKLKQSIGNSALSGAPACVPKGVNGGVCQVSMIQKDVTDQSDHWAYWKAGTSVIVYKPQSQFVVGDGWDMRMTKDFPIVGSNGGQTAADEGFPNGRAAFAVMSDATIGVFPSNVSEVLSLPFSDDRKEALAFQGWKLGEEYQSSLVNTIGTGMLKDYQFANHVPVLSMRIFILRSVDGLSYYAIQFNNYDRNAMVAVFEWRRLL